MGLFSRLFGGARRPRSEGQSFSGLTDPAFLEFVRAGQTSRVGLEVAAVYRCVSLISSTIGMLPTRIMERDANGLFTREAVEHPLWPILAETPNATQSAYAFKKLAMLRMLSRGNAYARIVRTGARIGGLIPIDNEKIEPVERNDGLIEYRLQTRGGRITLPQSEILHIFDTSTDGICGVSVLELAADAVSLSRDAREALGRIYKTGILATGAIEHPHKLSLEAKTNMRAQLESKFSGAEASGKWLILDEGMKAAPFNITPRDGQMIETSKYAVEDIARFFGVPRPLLGLDDTSWGSGVEQLATLFVRFGLSPLLVCCEQALCRSLLSPSERRRYTIDIDERELLRGSMKDQGEFFARALGAGGHNPWMEANEVRDLSGLPRRADGVGLKSAQQQGSSNVPPQTAAN